MASITLITGGARSGKSRYAQELAEAASERPLYLATARIWDEDFRQRIQRHKDDRGAHWINCEAEKVLCSVETTGHTVLLDCVTLWLTNWFHDSGFQLEASLEAACAEWDRFTERDMQLIVVTNELGMGVHPLEESARRFADLQGWMNQYIASKADQVVLMVSGIPLKIK